MAIPTVFAPIKKQDFRVKPFKTYKKFELSSVDLTDTGSGYNIVKGVHSGKPTPIGAKDANNDPTNSFDGSYQHVIWGSFNHMYYKHPYDPHRTLEHSNRRYTFKHLSYSASIFSVPYNDFGEQIKPKSVLIETSTFNLQDDGNGNLYDPSIDSSSFTSNHNVIAYWGFNDEFRRFKRLSGTVSKGNLMYTSRVFEPSEPSGLRNIAFDRGVEGAGMQAEFDGESYIITHDREEFNPDNTETFSIGFWINAPVSQSNESTQYNSIISKRGVVRKQVFGVNEKYNQNNLLIKTKHISSSIQDSLTDVYPYDIELINSSADVNSAGKIRVRRSNGILTSEITSSVTVTDGGDHYVTMTIDTGSMSLYVDGTLQGTAATLNSDDEDIYNGHSIIFGALNRSYDQGFSGSLDEIRFYETAITSDEIATLADSSSMAMFQTAVVGNVFYRQGNIVVSPLHPDYRDTFDGTWDVTFRGTHTIYQYEALCRIKKGSFNMSYNPTARKSYKSDLLINEMTGSTLRPYATTVGLYNEDGHLVAVAKMGQPIQMRDDVDINIIARWDV